MKKKLAILLSLAMVMTFALAACGSGGGSNEDLSDSKYVGTWKADSASFAGESDKLDDVITLTLNGDGTGTLAGVNEDGTDDVSDITWSPTSDGFKTQGDAKMTFKDDGDAIVSTVLGVKLRFVKADESGDAAAEGLSTSYRNKVIPGTGLPVLFFLPGIHLCICVSMKINLKIL